MGYECAQRSAREWIRTVLFYGEEFVESVDGLFLNFKLCLYTTFARIQVQSFLIGSIFRHSLTFYPKCLLLAQLFLKKSAKAEELEIEYWNSHCVKIRPSKMNTTTTTITTKRWRFRRQAEKGRRLKRIKEDDDNDDRRKKTRKTRRRKCCINDD